MYPMNVFALTPPFPRNHRVFVAMSFDSQFDGRWDRVLRPAISAIEIGDTRLDPYRVDGRKVSDSILTEILEGIGHARVVVADVSAVGILDDKPVRNANVMYEVGIAQAVRLPEEVVLFRSDSHPLSFDIANVRVNSYDPDGSPAEARNIVTAAVRDAIAECDLRRHATVARITAMLDVPTWIALMDAVQQGALSHPPFKVMRDALGGLQRRAAITRLLELGLIGTQIGLVTAETSDEELGKYLPTELGRAVFLEGLRHMGGIGPVAMPPSIK